MKWMRLRRVISATILPLFLASCASTHLPPISSTETPFQPARDEQKLWAQARAEEAKLREKAVIYPDPLLEDYLGEVVARLNPPEMATNGYIGYRVTVIEDPTLNAFAYPHGSLYVHTGLLARMESEDQLATVLGHEMTHVENRHMLRYQRSARNKQIGFTIAAVAGAVIVAGEEGRAVKQGKYGKAARIGVLSDILLGLGLTLGILAAVNGYGRDLEREADQGGFDKMSAAGYDTREAPKVYKALLEDHGDSGKAEAFFFGSHPRLAERIEAAEQWNKEHPEDSSPVRAAESDAFRRRLRPVVRDDARLNIERGRLELAELELNRVLGMTPEDPVAQMLMGRLRMVKATAAKDEGTRLELEQAARRAFLEAIRLDADLPEPHREIGVMAYREEDYETACRELGLYLELEPKADDAQVIRDYLLELRRDGHCPR